MKVFRRTPPPTPDARERALARLAVRPDTHARDSHLHSDGRPEYPEEREEVRGGWIPDQLRPDQLRNTRWTLAPRHVLILVALLALGLTWATWTYLRSRPEPIPNTTTTPGAPVSQSQSMAGRTQPAPSQSPGKPLVIVHIAGKVRRPGLVRAPAGSRVADVLTLAGGPLRGVDLTTLNLARQVADGEQIVVGQPSQAASPTSPSTAAASTPSNTSVNLNTATLAELDALPGVGPVLAQRILDYRTENGPFTTLDQLQEVPGVGPKKFDSLKSHVRI